MSDGHFIPVKTQYYVNDGFGRDTYIYNINGGFAPEKLGTRVHEVGKKIVFFIFRIIRYTKVTSNRIICINPFKACCVYKQWRWTRHLYFLERWRF